MSTLKFSDRVQVREGPRLSNAPQTPQSNNISAGGSKYNLGRFPQGMQPIATAPENGWFYAIRNNGENHLAVRHRGNIERLKAHKDFHGGPSRYMMGGAIPDAVGWLPVKRG
jgi:hypothetical protein